MIKKFKLLMKKIFILASFLLSALFTQAQQDVMISQYMFNMEVLNPGYAGSKDYMMATLLHRSQWTKFEGTPKTQIATLHSPWGDKRLGWGANAVHDHIGVTDRVDVFFDLAYHLPLNESLKLGMGIRAGISHFNSDLSKLTYWDTDDPTLNGGTISNTLPNTGAGLFLYSDKFYVGLSVPSVLSYDSTESINIEAEKEEAPNKVRHYYATAGVAIPITSELLMKPSILVKHVPSAPWEADFNLNFLIANLVWVGASYRTGDAVIGMVEFQLSRKLRIGYAYDYTLTDIQDYSSGTHEIMIGFDFGYDIMKMKTPRYF